MGGAVIVAAAARRPAPAVDGLILAAPAVREAMPLRELGEGMVAFAARTMPGNRATINANRDPRLAPRAAERLSGDPRVIRAVRIDAYAGLIALSSQASDAAGDVTLPTLVLLGSRDRAVPLVSACAAYARFAGPKAALYVADAPHRLLQAGDREAMFADILAWIDRTALPSLAAGRARPFAAACPAPAPD
jgi:alpha-beta hydrolase superfamily lysophospholipase